MIEENEARRRIVERVGVASAEETLPLAQVLGRVMSREMIGQVDLPGFDNSSMDGYAVFAAEASEGAVLSLQAEQPAGEDRGLELKPGSAIRIFTGAPMPRGADAVVMQEDVEAGGGKIRVVEGVVAQENVRPRGGDVCRGQRLFPAGSVVSPAALALLASQGYADLSVRPRPRVAVLSTGDELIEPGTSAVESLPAGCLYNSNGPMLAGLVREAGGVSASYHAPDDPAILRDTVASALEQSDFLLVAGGVSVGERDFVKEVLGELAVETDFWRVRLKPGKPFLFGSREGSSGSKFVFGLPGNPVSAFVTFHVFAAPALAAWQGIPGFESGDRLALDRINTVLSAPVKNPGDRPHYLRMKFDPVTGGLIPTGLQQSHALFGLSRADALVRLSAESELAEGDAVTAWRL